MKTLLSALCFCCAAQALAAPPANPAAAGLPVISTDSSKPLAVGDIYGGWRYRDPFRSAGSGSGPAVEAAPEETAGGESQEFSIHSLNLKGILQDRGGASALLVDPRSGAGYLLKGGRLFDAKNKRVHGVTGVLQAKQKSVILMTPDKDVQTLRLGEEEDASADKEQ